MLSFSFASGTTRTTKTTRKSGSLNLEIKLTKLPLAKKLANAVASLLSWFSECSGTTRNYPRTTGPLARVVQLRVLSGPLVASQLASGPCVSSQPLLAKLALAKPALAT